MSQYDELFAVFSTNKIDQLRFEDYLKSRCGYHYDAHLFQQLIELSLDQSAVDLSTFVSSFNETVDTLQFRSAVIQNKLREFRQVQAQIQEQLNNQSSASSLTIQVMEASNLEVAGYVQIVCGPKSYKTRTVKDGTWGEQFEFSTDRASEILIQIFDASDALVGTLSFPLDQLREAKLKDVNHNLQRQDGMKIKTKLHCILNFVHSKESLFKQELQKINEEMVSYSQELKETQQALLCLSKIFDGQVVKCANQLPPLLEVQEFEYKYVQILNETLRLEDWVRVFYKLMGALVALVILGSLYRTQFLDLTLLGILLSLVLLEEINQRYLRVFTYIFAVMLIGDFVWLCLFTGNWESSAVGGERKLEKFVIGISYLEFLVRIPFTVLLWRQSIEHEEFVYYLKAI